MCVLPINRHRLRHRYRFAFGLCVAVLLVACRPAVAQTGPPPSPSATTAPQTPALQVAADASQSGAAAQVAPAQTPAPPVAAPPRLPIVNRANEVMPSWLRVRAEFRERFEGFNNLGFVEGRDDEYALSRIRLNATVTPSK